MASPESSDKEARNNYSAVERDVPEIPAWLDEKFFEDIFVTKVNLERGKFKVNINAIVPTGGAGENYTSLLYRVDVAAECEDGTSKNLKLIAKAMITEPALKAFSVFTKEQCAYEQLLPSLERLWSDEGTAVRFGPRCWKSVEGDVDIIVLDDLCAEGYKVANRQKGADMNHARILLAKLAKFHAAGAVDYRKNGPIHELYNKGMVQPESKPLFDQYLKVVGPVFLASMETWTGHERYQNKMRQNLQGIYEKLRDATSKDDSSFVTLCHGDVWTNNHMFSYHESGEPSDVLLLDFQNPYYGSPVQDLFYYIISSSALELKKDHFDELVQYYQSCLAESLEKLNYSGAVPNLRDIHIEMLKRGFFGMQCLYGILPIVLADKNDNANFAGFFGEDEKSQKFRQDVFYNPIYHEHLRVLLKLFDSRGLLDFEVVDKRSPNTLIALVTVSSATSNIFDYFACEMISSESSSKEAINDSSEVEQDAPEIPAWLNEKFFEDIFVTKVNLERGKFKVNINAIVPTGGAGENYTSLLYRVDVAAECEEGTRKDLKLIVKAMIADPNLKAFNVFTKERCAYEQLLPSLERLWADVGTAVRFGPRCWKSVEGDVDIIVLDDLCAKGYKVANRQKGVDMNHARILLAKLAKFHAAAAVDYRKNGPIHTLFDKGMIDPETKPLYDQYLKVIGPVFLSSMETWTGHEKYQNKMRQNLQGIYEKLREVTLKDDSGFVTLCHGDVWTNNHMFSYDKSGEPSDVLLLDFQVPFYGSPVLDLFYYIISSTTLELKEDCFDELVQHYQSCLAESLKKLNYSGAVPNLRDIHIEMLKRGYFGMQCLYGIMPIVLADKNDNANFAGFFEESEENRKFQHDVYYNPRYHEHLRVLLKLFDSRGLLDFA
ncbi:uncharacterized protein LOC131428660 [Malaya genurostris]|uniref:uncharacterized protein LOC131428660 n=1 Tax=Malaya genurostris TaxID=325434 RepID=UPI0026F39F3D|nr:uncharacterized protein LOC131428660 [Malaya genurostris]